MQPTGFIEDRDLPCTPRPAQLCSGPWSRRDLERMGTVILRQSHPISYPALPEGAFTVRAVREVGPAAAPKPRLLDRVRAAIRTRHYSSRTEQAYVASIRRYILFHGKRTRSRST